MGNNPYSDLPKSAFWKTGVVQENPCAIEGIYKKKLDIPANAKIATARSCFSQHISRHLKKNGYNVLDVEPPPPELPKNMHQEFGFSMLFGKVWEYLSIPFGSCCNLLKKCQVSGTLRTTYGKRTGSFMTT